MLKPTLAALGLAIALAVVPASAQQSQPPTMQPDIGLVGLPVYSSDGQMLGQVTDTVRAGGRQAVRAEMGAFLGLGPSIILIDADVFQTKVDRVELKMTAAEVRERISNQGRKPSQ
jgi:hypothetical protein